MSLTIGRLGATDDDTPDAAVPEPAHRLRRTRRTSALRELVRETRIHPRQLVAPMFVYPGSGGRQPVGSMPGVERVTPDEALRDARALESLGIGGVILFGLPAEKDAVGTGGWVADGIVQETLRRFRDADLDLALIADLCLCEYTDHGHCGPLLADGSVDNDATIELYARTARSQADAGADIVAPSGMMDGQVRAIRAGLDAAGHQDTAILAYAAKTASAFYGPFRDAAGSTPSFGDRRGYQMDPANGRESMREMQVDVDEGADMLLVKPALPQLDILAAARSRFDLPDRRLPGERRVRLDRGRRGERLARPTPRAHRVHHRDPARGRRVRHHVRRCGPRGMVA